ncbi:MAG: MFS transporter, partial [Lachnospiraceae bacterium]|nr:MFS transporter [Lachnospiraceae bacterium]
MNSNNNTKSNFGKWGWSMIIYCAISYYLAAALSTDALNWFPSAFQAYHGWGEEFVNMCNSMAGIGGWIGVAAAIVFSIMTAKKGSRFMALFGNIITGVLCLVMAFTESQPVFFLMVICLTFVGGNIQLNCVPNNIMNVWFPKKKGLALGWASMGLPICTATIIVIFSAIGNPRTAYIMLGIVCFVFGIVSLFWAKNTPEEVGCTPDNEPVDLEEAKALMAKQEAAAKDMTLGVIAKDKNTWLIGIGHGLLWMPPIGLVSNCVTHMGLPGIDSNFAVMMLTV